MSRNNLSTGFLHEEEVGVKCGTILSWPCFLLGAVPAIYPRAHLFVFVGAVVVDDQREYPNDDHFSLPNSRARFLRRPPMKQSHDTP